MIDNNYVKDYHLQRLLKKAIMNSSYFHSLKTLLNCGLKAQKNGVSILTNGVQARIFGSQLCKNTWACPICSAVYMSKQATKIAAAIDALETKGYAAIMITFTVYHDKGESCEHVTQLLYKTWENFTRSRISANKRGDVFGNFRGELGILHSVRVAEITYGENGWHPHFHCLYFVPKANAQKTLEYEQALQERWRYCMERQQKKLLGYVKTAALGLSDIKHDFKTPTPYISKNDDGTIRVMKSSDYLCGWGADYELTGNYRKQASHEGHLTPYQMLQAADQNEDDFNKYMPLYLEFAHAMIKHRRRRFDYSRNGLNAIIQNHMNSQGYKEMLAQKKMSYKEAKKNEKWYVVCWFTPQQWLSLCQIDLFEEIPAIEILLSLARAPDAFDLICELMRVYNISEPLMYDPTNTAYSYLQEMVA